jgi:hypothetical protein
LITSRCACPPTYSVFHSRGLQVLRVHAIMARTLPSPSTPRPAHTLTSTLGASLESQIPLMREQAVEVLAAALGGDRLAAEYVLLQVRMWANRWGRRTWSQIVRESTTLDLFVDIFGLYNPAQFHVPIYIGSSH